MRRNSRRLISVFMTLIAAAMLQCCGIYSFSGTSIQPDVHSITIDLFEYKALRVNPSLSTDMTEALKDKFRRMTRLEQVDMDGDLEIAGAITGYDVRATAVTAGEFAAMNRLTVTIQVNYTNRKYPEEDFDQSFSAYSDYDSNQSLDAVESSLCEDIIDQLCELVLNATVANW